MDPTPIFYNSNFNQNGLNANHHKHNLDYKDVYISLALKQLYFIAWILDNFIL